MAELYELANLVDEHGFTDFEFENANIRVRLSKNPAPQIVQAAWNARRDCATQSFSRLRTAAERETESQAYLFRA